MTRKSWWERNAFRIIRPFVRGIHRWLLDSPHKGPNNAELSWVFLLAWTIFWINSRGASGLTCPIVTLHTPVSVATITKNSTKSCILPRYATQRTLVAKMAVMILKSGIAYNWRRKGWSIRETFQFTQGTPYSFSQGQLCGAYYETVEPHLNDHLSEWS